jgi:predicted anti-sigma-YlaC factor YlaD
MNSDNCIQEIDLSTFLDGELPANEIKRVEAHLADCRDCRDVCERMRADRDLLLECMPDIEPPEYLKQRLFREIHTLAETPRRSGIRTWADLGRILPLRSRSWMAACASVLIFVVTFSVFQYQRRLEDKRILAEIDRTRTEWMVRGSSINPFDTFFKGASARMLRENPFRSYLNEH